MRNSTTRDNQVSVDLCYLGETFDLDTCGYSLRVILEEHGVLYGRSHWLPHDIYSLAQPIRLLRTK